MAAVRERSSSSLIFRFLVILGTVLGVGFFHPQLASAQLITGQLTERDTGLPVAHTHVLLVDEDDREVLRAATGGDGRFTIPAPAAGQYRLLAERIGWDVTPSERFRIDLGQTRRLEYEAAMTSVVLPGLASDSTACRIEDNPRAAMLWRETQKALRGVVWTVNARGYRYTARTFARDLGPDGHHVRSENDSMATDLDQVPYAALDPESLAEGGYVKTGEDGSTTYFVPDAAALVDDRFAVSHCFSSTGGTASALVGLSFTPTSARLSPDIAGTVWLHATTMDLVRIDFQYLNDPSDNGDEPARGAIEFHRIGELDWMVRAWSVRMPTVAALDSAGVAQLSGFAEMGAYVTEVTDGERQLLFSDATVSVLSGTVYDSTQVTPLEDVVVALVGTKHWTTTDRAGRFTMAGYFDGDYSVVFGNARLDSVGFVSDPRRVSLERGSESSLDLVVPSVAVTIGRRCSEFVAAPNRRVLVGVVKDAESQAPVPAAVVSVFRQVIPENLQHLGRADLNATTNADSLGAYTLCGVPIGETIMVYAEGQNRTSNFVSVTFRADGVEFDQQRLEGSGHPVARLDLELVAPRDRTNRLSGVVTNQATETPIPGARVQIDGTGFVTQTDSEGTFRLIGVPSGRFRLLVRQLGYRMLQHRVEIPDNTALALSPGTLALIPGDTAIALDPVTISAQAVIQHLVGFEQRRNVGLGSFVDREEFVRWNPALATDVLRHMRGVRVRPNPRYGTGSDTRRWLIESSRDVGGRITRVVSTNAERIGATAGRGGGAQSLVYECPVLLFLDGMFLGDAYTTNINNIVTATNLLAVEFYTPAQVPIRFAFPGSTCGVVVFWTR